MLILYGLHAAAQKPHYSATQDKCPVQASTNRRNCNIDANNTSNNDGNLNDSGQCNTNKTNRQTEYIWEVARTYVRVSVRV